MILFINEEVRKTLISARFNHITLKQAKKFCYLMCVLTVPNNPHLN